jgi:hypothetical protein
MDFSMPACVKKPEWAWFFAFAAMLLSAGCSGQADSGRFEVTQVEPSWASGRFHVISEQRLTLSSEARNALIHGVPLTVELELLLRDASEKTRVANNTSSYEIRYLPLSEHYQLALPGERKLMTFPRLRHVLAELSRIDISFETGSLPAGEYELLARIRLDKKKMPPPMRLPALLSSEWRHESEWTFWPLEIEAGS